MARDRRELFFPGKVWEAVCPSARGEPGRLLKPTIFNIKKESHFLKDDLLKMGCSVGDICTHFCFLVSINRIFFLTVLQATRQTQYGN